MTSRFRWVFLAAVLTFASIAGGQVSAILVRPSARVEAKVDRKIMLALPGRIPEL